MPAPSDRRTALLVHPGAEMFGSDRMLLESARGLVEAGARVVVALPGRGPLDVELRSAGAEVVIVPMLVLRKALLSPRALPTLLRDAFRGFGAAWRLIGAIRPDVIYVSTIIIPQWPVIARLRRIEAVTHVHEAEASTNRHVMRALTLPHLASQRIIVNSRFTLQTLHSTLGRAASRARIVLNGVAATESPVAPRPSVDNTLRLLYVGRLSPRKGTDLAVRTAIDLHRSGEDVSLTVVGSAFDGYEWYEQDLRRLAADSGADIVFAGYRSDIWPWLADADIVVVPSRGDESFGNTSVEGILALRAVVTSDVSGLREAIEGYTRAWSFAADDQTALTMAVRKARAAWREHTPSAPADRELALRRHSPAEYRRAVRAVILPSTDDEHASARTVAGSIRR